jgi:hypothetical protein
MCNKTLLRKRWRKLEVGTRQVSVGLLHKVPQQLLEEINLMSSSLVGPSLEAQSAMTAVIIYELSMF